MMKYKESISVFLPAYNEEKNLKIVIEEILEFLKKSFMKFELLIIVNISSDKTSEIAKKLAKRHKNVRIINQSKFVGYGTQLKVGWENAKNDLIFYTDSDRQFDIKELKKFMDYIQEYDIVIGYRKKRKDPFMRILYSKIYNFTLRILLGLNFKDVDCAFKLCKRKVIDKIKPLIQDRGADAEFLVKSQRRGFKIKELPVTHFPRKAGTSEAESGGKFFVKIKFPIIKALIKETLSLRRL